MIVQWVDRQRQMYKLRNQGKKTALTDDRVSALEEVGFEWAVPRGKEPANPRPQGQAIAAAAGHQSIMAASPASRGRPKKADGVVGVGSPTGTLRKIRPRSGMSATSSSSSTGLRPALPASGPARARMIRTPSSGNGATISVSFTVSAAMASPRR